MEQEKPALERLLTAAENLTPSGEIGDGMVAEFKSLAARARFDLGQIAEAFRELLSDNPPCDCPICESKRVALRKAGVEL